VKDKPEESLGKQLLVNFQGEKLQIWRQAKKGIEKRKGAEVSRKVAYEKKNLGLGGMARGRDGVPVSVVTEKRKTPILRREEDQWGTTERRDKKKGKRKK